MEAKGGAQAPSKPSAMKRSATSFFVAKSKSDEGRFSADTAAGLKAAFKVFDTDGDVSREERSCPGGAAPRDVSGPL